MGTLPRIQPSLLGRLNERQVLRALQSHGPLSRAEVARRLGLSAPTVSKAVTTLLRAGLVEEGDAPEPTLGRPATRLRLNGRTAQVLGVVLDVGQCQVVAAGLDGTFDPDSRRTLTTPRTYPALLDAIAETTRELTTRPEVTTLGIGISMPGLIDHRRQQGVLSPNLSLTNGHAPGHDLKQRLGIECVLVHESNALCLAERHHGDARGLDDFALLDLSVGVGLGVMSGGRLVTGHSGLAGEVGHITVVVGGEPCGCGNRGCLETVAGDAALARRVGRRLRRSVTVEEVVELARGGKLRPGRELHETVRYLAIGVAAVINLFNPSTLFLHGRLFEVADGLLERVIELARQRALGPSFADCVIRRARGSKLQGAVAGAIEHLTCAVGPSLES